MFNLYALIKKYAFDRYVHSGVIAIIDILMSVIASILTLTCIDLALPDSSIPLHIVVKVVCINIIATSIAVYSMHTHRIIIRYSTISDIWKLAVATIIKEFFMCISAILLLKFNENIVRAKVKGNFKSHYETGIKFTKAGVKPTCNCPLEEPWCKHAIALGFASLKIRFSL